MIDEDLQDQAKKEVNALEETRILMGFIGPGEAIQHLHRSDKYTDPVPPEREQQRLAENKMDYLDIHTRAENNLGAPSAPFQDPDVEVLDLPSRPEIEEHIEEFREELHFREVTNNFPNHRWQIAQIPIESLVAFQKTVTTATYASIPTAEDDGLDAVLEYTLPTGPSNLLMRDQIGLPNAGYSGVEIVSRDPNVQVFGPEVNQLEGHPTGTVSVEFLVRSTPNIAQVAHYEDRYILKNGYHRSYQLLQAGETHLPCILIEAEKWEETGGDNPAHFDEDTVMDERPPLLSDFQTDASVEIKTPGRNTVMRITAETSKPRR